MLRRILIVVVPVMILACLAGCSTTKIIVSWKDETAPGRSLKRPLVMAIVPRDIVRNKLEDEFVKRLAAVGVEAVPSHRLFPDMGAINPDAVKASLASSGCDGILVSRFMDVKQETVNVPARTDVYGGYYGRPAYYGSFNSYYANSVSIVSSPAYSYVEKVYRVETNVFSASDGKLLWTAATETEDIPSIDKAITDFTNVIMKDLRKDQVF